MSGIKSGVAKQILDEEKRAIFTHCYGHALNLACNDAVKCCKILEMLLKQHERLPNLLSFHRREMCFFWALDVVPHSVDCLWR